MKKILAFALFLCMLCTSALADTLVTNGGGAKHAKASKSFE